MLDTTNLTTEQLATLLLPLAAQANEAKIKNLGPNYPPHWNLVATFALQAGQSETPMPVQCLLARSPADPANPSANQLLVLAIGINWGNYFRNYNDANLTPIEVDPSLLQDDGAKILPDFQATYMNRLRKEIWGMIKTNLEANDVLYICGMALGGAIAQLASLDLRVGHVVPALERSPNLDYQPACFTYSAPNISNQSLSTAFQTAVVDVNQQSACFNYRIDNSKSNIKVDFFPLEPDSADGFYPMGNVLPTTQVALPADPLATGPWLERGNIFYTTSLKGPLNPGPRIPNQDIQRPSGYNPVFAHILTQLMSATYQFAQNSKAGPTLPGGYQTIINGQFIVDGKLWGQLYINSSGDNILAIRGTQTWLELRQIAINSNQVTSTLVSTAWVHGGIHNFYFGEGLFKDAKKTTFRAALAKLLSDHKITTLTICGHGVGGSLANLAALDFILDNSKGVSISNVYTFGAIALGDQAFATEFQSKLGDKVYNVIRIYDQISISLLRNFDFGYQPLGATTIFQGRLQQEENSYHAINGYYHLLDPTTN